MVDGSENIISRGRGRHFENTAPEGQICSTDLAHAELNALIQLNKEKHPDIYSFTLYTTVEPCALCFGAFYMSSVKNLCFAARDPYGGSTNLYGTTDYLKRKEKYIVGPEKN